MHPSSQIILSFAFLPSLSFLSPFILTLICCTPFLLYYSYRYRKKSQYLLNSITTNGNNSSGTDNIRFATSKIWSHIQGHRSRKLSPKGCRRLGCSPRHSNLEDVNNDGDNGDGNAVVKALFAYPIKGCAGVEFDVASVVSTGLAFDRLFCFGEFVKDFSISTSSARTTTTISPAKSGTEDREAPGYWEFRTLRNSRFSKLTLIRPEIWIPDPASPSYAPHLNEVKSQGVLVVYYPRVVKGIWALPVKLGTMLGLCPCEESFWLPLALPRGGDYPSVPVRVWKDSPMAFDYGRHLPHSLRDFLAPDLDANPVSKNKNSRHATSNPHLTLFRADPAHTREIFRCAPRRSDLGFQPHTAFADAYPLHMLNLSSVRDVGRRCYQSLPQLSARRFRANIIIQGPVAYAEDSWKRIRVGGSGSNFSSVNDANEKEEQNEMEKGVEIYTCSRTVRCRVPNVDPDTGVRHPSEPDRTLKSFRCIDAGDPKNACLGMQLVPARQEFTLRVGDPVTVLETGEHFYIKMCVDGDV